MWAYIVRRLLYNIPVYLGIVLLVMAALRVNDPVYAFLGKNASAEQIGQLRTDMGLDKPFVVQYADFLWDIVRLDFSGRSWEQKRPVGEMIGESVMPSLMLTIPTMVITSVIGVSVALVSAFRRGRLTDKTLMFAAVLGMSVSYLVYIVLGQYFGAFWVNQQIAPRELFAVEGYEAVFAFEPGAKEGAAWFSPGNWVHYCLLPVLIGVVVAVGYDTRFYRSVMVEECTKDYIRTARAKGASSGRIMFVHMLKNAMIPIVTRVMISFPFLLTGEILVETYFNIPGMGRLLITAINGKDFPVVQAVTAVFAAAVIVTVILTDVLYAVFDPRVRLK